MLQSNDYKVMHRYTQANNLVRYTMTSSSLVPTVCSNLTHASQTEKNFTDVSAQNLFATNSITIHPLAVPFVETSPRSQTGSNINSNTTGNENKRLRGLTPRGDAPTPDLEMLCDSIPAEEEPGNRVIYNTAGKSSPSKNSKGKKRGKLNSKEESKADEKENKKKSKADEKENKKMVPSENPEIRALLKHNYPGRSDQDNLVCYVCCEGFYESVHLKNHIVNLHLRHIPIQEFAVCPDCELVCRSRSQFVEHALKSRNACRSLVKRNEKPATRRKGVKVKSSIAT